MMQGAPTKSLPAWHACCVFFAGPLVGGTLTDKYHSSHPPPGTARHVKFPEFQVGGGVRAAELWA